MISLMTLVAKAEQHDNDLKELREQVSKLSALIEQIAESDQRDRDAAKLARQSEQQFQRDTEREIEARLKQFEAKLAAMRR